ncbi:nicotinamide-nucleotide amidase [Vibrio sp.]|nr:nicotinamide-nucleotide amidase [Vibrio sp.]
MERELEQLSYTVGQRLKQHNAVLCSAESCTGGGVAAAITDIAGSSEWFDRAFVTYSNEAKQQMLGVNKATLDSYGAVSEPIVEEMTSGALKHSLATVAVAISGIAGPAGGSAEKPVGTVCFCWENTDGWKCVETLVFPGDRAQVRKQAVFHALKTLQDHYS